MPHLAHDHDHSHPTPTTKTAVGIAVVSARRLAVSVDVSGRAIALLPAASALVICGVGCLLTIRALQQLA